MTSSGSQGQIDIVKHLKEFAETQPQPEAARLLAFLADTRDAAEFERLRQLHPALLWEMFRGEYLQWSFAQYFRASDEAWAMTDKSPSTPVNRAARRHRDKR